jgi:ketosteroid isomerase-like protein
MSSIDADPELLRITAEGSAHAYEQSSIHIDAEIEGALEPLIETLTPDGPYAYTILPEVRQDGSVSLPILTTREEIADAYAMIRGYSDLLSVSALTEVRGSWYTFQDNISRTRVKETGETSATQTLGLFPSGRGEGITGELIWVRVPRAALGAPAGTSDASDDETFVRERLFDRHERYLDALRAADVDAVLDDLHDGVASAIRDYVDDTGTLTTLEGKGAHRAYYEALFDKYEIRSVVPLHRVTDQWYVFAELRVEATSHSRGADASVAFHTAEFFMPSNDGRFIARIGHGTPPVQA